MDSRTEIKKIALQKLKDAELLYDNGSYDNTFYLAGYCVELALKAFYKNWEYICGWKEDCRYNISGSRTQAQALEILDAIRYPTNGFLKWIKKYW